MSRAWSCLLALLLVGCAARAAGPVDLSGTWPAASPAPSLDDETTRLTREATLRDGYQEALSVVATLRAPTWITAWTAQANARAGRTGDAAATAHADAQTAAAEHLTVALVVTTWDRAENDLHRGARASWQLTLLTDDGRALRPTRVRRDKRPHHVLRAEYPRVGDFAQVYLAEFANQPALLAPGTQAVRVRLASPRGAVELRWDAARP